jgi:hypothetical protein
MRLYEVGATKDEIANVEVTRVTLTKEKIKGEAPETWEVKFANFADYLKPTETCRENRTERRKVGGGVFTCRVYTFTDDKGREGFAWYANEWPGLCVRRQIKDKEYEQVSEVVEFND